MMKNQIKNKLGVAAIVAISVYSILLVAVIIVVVIIVIRKKKKIFRRINS